MRVTICTMTWLINWGLYCPPLIPVWKNTSSVQGTEHWSITLRMKGKGGRGGNMRTKEKSNRVLSVNEIHKSLKAWNGFSNMLKMGGVGSSMHLMCLNLRSDVPWCVSTYKREENVERGEKTWIMIYKGLRRGIKSGEKNNNNLEKWEAPLSTKHKITRHPACSSILPVPKESKIRIEEKEGEQIIQEDKQVKEGRVDSSCQIPQQNP